MDMWRTFGIHPGTPGILPQGRTLSAWRVITSDRKFLLPVIVTVSLFIALSGMRAPRHSGPPKSKFSQPGAMEIQGKETDEGFSKSDQVAFLPRLAFSPATEEYRGRLIHHDNCVHEFLFSLAAPSRASPSVNSFLIKTL